MYVNYRTVDGTANAGSDFEYTEDTVRFEPGETVKTIHIPIIDDDVFEEDEYFTVELFNVHTGGPEGMFDTNANSAKIARLDAPAVAHVIILDDDHAGVFTFANDAITVSGSAGMKLQQLIIIFLINETNATRDVSLAAMKIILLSREYDIINKTFQNN